MESPLFMEMELEPPPKVMDPFPSRSDVICTMTLSFSSCKIIGRWLTIAAASPFEPNSRFFEESLVVIPFQSAVAITFPNGRVSEKTCPVRPSGTGTPCVFCCVTRS